MFYAANEQQITLNINGVEDSEGAKLQVLAFDGIEGINSEYVFEITLVSKHLRYDITKLLSKTACLSFTPDNNNIIHGVITFVKRGAIGKDYSTFKLLLVPRFYHLNNETDQRAFIDKSVPEIITSVLSDKGYQQGDNMDFVFKLREDYPTREFCCQYDESTAHFIYRLCEEEGLNIHYQHTKNNHCMVFSDDNNYFPNLENKYTYASDTGFVADHPVFKRFDVNLNSTTTEASYRNYNFQNMKIPEGNANLGIHNKGKEANEPSLEYYDYPQQHLNKARGDHYSKIQIQRLKTYHLTGEAYTDVPELKSGYCFEVEGYYPLEKMDTSEKWLAAQIYHQGRQPQVIEALGSENSAVLQEPSYLFKYYKHPIAESLYFPFDEFKQGYRNVLLSVPKNSPFRPQILHPKQQVLGSQTAIVTGAAGEEIYCDEYGRIKVLFHWDRINPQNEHSSHWIRVASNWAHDGYGAVVIPRVGMEVKVDFLEGDIDNPIITGAIHNGVNKVPYDLPANKTRSVFKTSSSKGGVGSNELRIEDKAGQEQIFVQAQRDYDQLTKHNHSITVYNNSHLQVNNEHSEVIKGNRYTTNQSEEHHLTDLDRRTQIMGNDELTIGESEHKVIGTIYTSQSGQEITLTAGEQIVVDGGLSLSLKAGGQHIVLNPAGIWFSSTTLPYGGSTPQPREGCPTGMCPASPTVGNPVNPILGCKILTPETDIALPAPDPFIFNRSYNSSNSRVGSLGQGWTISGESTALQVNTDKITVIDGYGRHIEFSTLSIGQSHYSASEGFYLQRGGLTENDTLNAGEYWLEVIDKNLLADSDNYFIFLPTSCFVFSLIEQQYRLIQTISKQGYANRYTWHNNTISTIQDSFGRFYALAYQPYPAINHQDNGQRLMAIGLIDLDHYSDSAITKQSYTLDSPAIDWLVYYEYSIQGDLVKVNNKQGDSQRIFAYQDHILIAHGQPNGQYNRYHYDDYTPQGKVIEQHEQDGLSYYYSYQDDHTEVVDSLNRSERYYFKGTGGDQRWTALQRADGSMIQFEYDELGRQTATIDPLNRKTTTTYNEQGKITAKNFADGSQIQYVLDDKLGQPIQVIDPEGHKTTLSYDDKGNITTITNALEATTTYCYEDSQQPDKPTKIIEANGATKQLTWHANGQLASYTDCSNFTSTRDYNDLGLLIAETNAKGETTQYHYNQLNQLTKTTLADGSIIAYEYDSLGRLIKTTNPAGQSSTFSYNRFGQVIKSTNTEGLSKHFSYDSAKRLVKLINENGAETTFSYDQLDRLIEEIGFDQHSQQKCYNAADELISLTDSNGSTLTYQYDLLGRLIERNIPATANTQGITERFSWTASGLLQQATNGQSTITYHYDAIGQLLNENQQQSHWQHTIQHQYDNVGNTEQTQYNHAPAIKWLRYGSGHIHSLLIGQSQINYKRDELHRELQQQTFIKEQSQPLFEANKAYNPVGLLATQQINNPQQTSWTRNYQYDPLGQLTQINDNLLPSIDYQYDNLGRLVSSQHPTAKYEYYYDSANNRCSKEQIINQLNEANLNFTQGTPDPFLLDFTKEAKQSQQANPVWLDNRITHLNNQHYYYDNAGNLITIKQGQQQFNLYYDGANRLSKVEKLNHNSLELTANYGYDCFSRRISKTITQQGKSTTTYYGWDENNLVTEQTHQQQTTIVYSPNSFVPLVRMEQHNQNQEQVQLSFYQVDHLGTPLKLIDELGNITWQAEPDDWRALKNAHGVKQPIRFQGQYEDSETGLYYNRNRFYSPVLGRYINHDPIGLEGGVNTYNYPVNPNNYIDPLGLWDLPLLPQGLVDFVVGFGDGIVTITTFGYGDLERTREALGCGGNVNMNSNEYLLTNTVGKMYGILLPFAPKGLNLTGNTIKVAHYAPEGISPALQAGNWVMTGSSKNPMNYLMSGILQKGYPMLNSSTTVVPKAALQWPKGAEAWKGIIGQRIYVPK